MPDPSSFSLQRLGALALIRALRRLDYDNGIKHSGIALDIGMLLYERAGTALTVKEICGLTGYSGPTVRLVVTRLAADKILVGAIRQRRTMVYALTPRGNAAFDAYVERIWQFGQAVAQNDLAAYVAAVAAVPARPRVAKRRRATGKLPEEPPEQEAAD